MAVNGNIVCITSRMTCFAKSKNSPGRAQHQLLQRSPHLDVLLGGAGHFRPGSFPVFTNAALDARNDPRNESEDMA